jgi:PAS domain S-box-containing protein
LVFIGANPAADKILGVNNNQFIGKTIEQAFPPLKDTEIPGAYRKAAAKAVPYYTEQIEYKDAQISGAFEVYAFQTSPNNMVAMFQDITDRKRTEEELRIEKIQLDQLFESAQEAIVMANNQGTALRINRDFTKLFGYTPGEAIGKPLDELIADERLVEDAKNITKRVANGEKVSLETVRKRKDGTSVDVSVLASPIVIDGEQVAVYGIYRDISKSKSAERKIKNSLKEKELLLQEIHHRVKNNLQIISSLLRLQSRMVDDVGIQEMFEVSQDRIRTIALIHEKLHRSKDMAKIDFSEYLEGLVTHLAKIYNPPRTNIKLNFEIKKIFLDINTAIPCGLIISELVTNALKYAFQGMESGTIDLEMRRKNGKLMLTLRDSGVGLPENMDFKKLDSLGMQIVQDLVEQLGGEINVSRDGGTTFHITL